RERAEKYLKQLQLWDKRRGISRALSGGMKRRLMIARALMHEPRLLILDEPTAGVDIEIRRSMWEFLREINARGTTIILTTHYLEEAETLCRNIAIISGGRIVERDRMSSLLRRLHVATFVLNLRDSLSVAPRLDGRSEEHTSELQSPCNLVCRLLLEKKKEIFPNSFRVFKGPTRSSKSLDRAHRRIHMPGTI